MKQYSHLTKDVLYEELFVNGLNRNQVAKKYNVPKGVVYSYVKSYGLKELIIAENNP